MPKLTKEIIDNLIREAMLNEDFPYADAAGLYGKTPSGKGSRGKKQFFKSLAGQQPDDDKVEGNDFDYLLSNLGLITPRIESDLIALTKTKNAPRDAKEKARAVLNAFYKAMEEKKKSRQTITQPQFRTAGGEVSDFPDELKPILDRLFVGKTGIKPRIQELSKISKLYFDYAADPKKNQTQLTNKSNQDFLSEIMLMEYFAEMVNSFDIGAGQYMLEYLLALLVGGRVTGKDTTDAGKMGAIDFDWQGGAGSAKYFANRSAGIKQSAAGFPKGKRVTYVIALRRGSEEQITKPNQTGGTDPSKAIAVDVYSFYVKRISDDGVTPVFEVKATTQSTNLLQPNHISGGDLVLRDYIGSDTNVGTLYLASVRTQTFREMVYKSVSNSAQATKKAMLEEMEKFFVQLDAASSSCKQFAATGDLDKGTNTLTAIDMADAAFGNFANKMVGASVIDDGTNRTLTTPPVQENKQKKFQALDKMIEELMLEHLQGDTDDNN